MILVTEGEQRRAPRRSIGRKKCKPERKARMRKIGRKGTRFKSEQRMRLPTRISLFFCHKLLPVDERAVSEVDEMMCKFSMKLLVRVYARSCLLKLVECGLVRTFFCMHIRNAEDGLLARNSLQDNRRILI